MTKIEIDLPPGAFKWLYIMAKKHNLAFEDFLLREIGDLIRAFIESIGVDTPLTPLEIVSWVEAQVPETKQIIESLTNEKAGLLWEFAEKEATKLKEGRSLSSSDLERMR